MCVLAKVAGRHVVAFSILCPKYQKKIFKTDVSLLKAQSWFDL